MRTKPPRHTCNAGSRSYHVEAGRVELEKDVALGKVRATIKRRQIARECELSGGLNRVPERGFGGATPTHQQVADAQRCGTAARNVVGFDESLGAARGRVAVVRDATCDRHHLARGGKRTTRSLCIR